MNKFREKIIKFLEYLEESKKELLILWGICIATLILTKINILIGQLLLLIAIVISPWYISKIIENKKIGAIKITGNGGEKNSKSKRIKKNKNKTSKVSSNEEKVNKEKDKKHNRKNNDTVKSNTSYKEKVKSKIKKIYKVYVITMTTIFTPIIVLACCNMVLIALLFANIERNVGLNLIMFAVTWIVFVSISTLFGYIIQMVVLVRNSYMLRKTYKEGKKIRRRILFKHMMSMALFALFALPIIMISDAVGDMLVISNSLRALYIIILLYYSVFDIEERVENYEELLKPKREFFKFKNMK